MLSIVPYPSKRNLFPSRTSENRKFTIVRRDVFGEEHNGTVFALFSLEPENKTQNQDTLEVEMRVR